MTFILNILHKDMSLLAADRKALAVAPVTRASPGVMMHADERFQIDTYKKITLNQSRSLAIGIAGLTHEHHYTQKIERNVTVDQGLLIIQDHVNGFLRIKDRASLIPLSSAMLNQGIASFYDTHTGTYFSMEYRFSPVQCSTRLHPARDRIRLLCAGTGSEHFEDAVGAAEIEAFIASTTDSFTTKACLLWVRDAFKKVSAKDSNSGEEPMFVISTRSNLQFRST